MVRAADVRAERWYHYPRGETYYWIDALATHKNEKPCYPYIFYTYTANFINWYQGEGFVHDFFEIEDAEMYDVTDDFVCALLPIEYVTDALDWVRV
jgi:hypothetical protein